MGEVKNLNNPTLDTVEYMESLPEAAKDREAIGFIGLFIVGEDAIVPLSSHDFTLPSLLGYLETAKLSFAIEAVVAVEEE